MNDRLSRTDFDQLIARASTLDAEGIGQLDLERARAIALEVGISPEAWDAALLERAGTPVVDSPVRPSLPFTFTPSVLAIAISGVVTGLLSGTIGSSAGPLALFLGALAIVVGGAVAVAGATRISARANQLQVAAWWFSVTAGILLGLRIVHPDPLVFGSLGWAGCASLTWAVRRWMRRTPAPSTLAGTPIV